MANQATAQSKWYVIDAKEKVLGRLASDIAFRLRGKHKTDFTPHVATGDHIVVINAEQLVVTGNKLKNKLYHRHSGYPGGLKTITFEKLMARSPEQVLKRAVKGMLPRGPLGRQMFSRLKVYVGDAHPHQAQMPEIIE